MTIPRYKEQALSNQCRLCAKRIRKGTKIFEDKKTLQDNSKPCTASPVSPHNHLVELIFDCIRIKVSEDDALPKHICTDCEKKLTSWLSFFTKSKETQETLLQELKVPKKKEVSSTLVESDNVVESCSDKSSNNTTSDKHNDTETEQQNTATINKVIVTNHCLNTSNSENKESKQLQAPIKKVEECVETKEENASYIHTCPVCKKTFSQRNKFAQHLACHVSPEPETPHLWPCPVCPKKLRSCDGLARHQETHLDSRNYCCHVCGRLFQTLPCLLNHVRVQHGPETGPGARPRHTCPICSRVFRQSTHMVQHLRTHTGERPYRCRECGSSFTTSGQLQRHSQAVHQGLKRFKCDLCGKEFLYSHNYKAHMQRHDGNKELQCDVCDKEFFTKNALFRHRRFHTGEKPFQCDICGKKFADCSNRKRHRLQHHKMAPPETQGSESTLDVEGSVAVLLMEQSQQTEEERAIEEGGKTFTSLRTFLMEDFLHQVELVTFDEGREVDDVDDELSLVRQAPGLESVVEGHDDLPTSLQPVEVSLHPVDLASSLQHMDSSPEHTPFSLENMTADPVNISSPLPPASPDDLSPSLQPMGRSPLHITPPSLRNSPVNMSPTLDNNPLDLSPCLQPMGGSPLHIPTSDFLLTLHGY